MSGNFLTEFIAKCVEEGKATPAEMCQVAEERINEVNEEIKRAEELRLEKANLHGVIRQLGGSKPKELREYKNADFSIPFDKLADHYKVLCANICSVMEDDHNGLTISDLMNKFSSMGVATLEDNELVYWSIKWLGGRGIVDKDDSMCLIKGPNWEDRPHVGN